MTQTLRMICNSPRSQSSKVIPQSGLTLYTFACMYVHCTRAVCTIHVIPNMKKHEHVLYCTVGFQGAAACNAAISRLNYS
jgi:hypothetical protein